jgi:hypothetical protein
MLHFIRIVPHMSGQQLESEPGALHGRHSTWHLLSRLSNVAQIISILRGKLGPSVFKNVR